MRSRYRQYLAALVGSDPAILEGFEYRADQLGGGFRCPCTRRHLSGEEAAYAEWVMLFVPPAVRERARRARLDEIDRRCRAREEIRERWADPWSPSTATMTN